MRILMTQRELRRRGGTELFTIETAVELRRRGHDAAVYCPRVGDLAELILAGGVPVKSRLSEIPWVPQVIHGQHHLQAMAAMAYFESTPAIYHCHGVTPWVEKPPVHPGIHYYVMMCSWMIPRLDAELGISTDRVTSIPNFVNTARFSRKRTPPKTIQRALLFGNGAFPIEDVHRLETVCQNAGLTLDKIGSSHGNPQPRPEVFLLDYDLVFAIGKCAMEALACGCAVIPVLPGQAGHLVTPENFSGWVASNFSPRYYSSAAQVDLDWLREELATYSPENTVATCAAIREKYHLHAAVDQLEALYERTIRESQTRPRTSAAKDFAPYLETSNMEVDQIWAESKSMRSQLHKLEKKVQDLRQEVADQKLAWKLTVAQLRPSIFGRWWLSKIQRRVPRRPPPPGREDLKIRG